MMAPMDGFLLEVIECVIHPSHVPLACEPESTIGGRAGDTRPGGRFFCCRDDTLMVFMHGFVELTEKLDGLQILPSPMTVGNPLVMFPAVIQVKHGGNGINT